VVDYHISPERISLERFRHALETSEMLPSRKILMLLWNGREDAYHDSMQELAKRNGITSVSTPGDHVLALEQ